MAIVYSAPGVPGGEVSPGSGSTGFSSNAVAFTNSSGQLTASTALRFTGDATSGTLVVSSTVGVSLASMSGPLVIGNSTAVNLGIGQASIQCRTSAGGTQTLTLQGSGGGVQIGGNTTIGTSNTSVRLSLPSTVNISTAVGTSGAAAAPPANPEVYVKIQVPNSAHTLTTLYIPCYLST